PTRSVHGARLKKSHHTTTANPHATPPSTANMAASRATKGTMNQSSHCSTTRATPGHSRSGLREVGLSVWEMRSSLWGMSISEPYASQQAVCSSFLGGTLLPTQDSGPTSYRSPTTVCVKHV